MPFNADIGDIDNRSSAVDKRQHVLLSQFPIIISKYVTRYTFGKLYDWPIQIHLNERAGYMQRMVNCH